MSQRTRPYGVTATSFFFLFGSVMSGLACVMLLFPGSLLDGLWRLNPHAQAGFESMGAWAVLLMMVVCAACVTTAVELWRCRRSGLWIALAILGINLVGDTVNATIGNDWRTLVGLPIGGFIFVYLLRNRQTFRE